MTFIKLQFRPGVNRDQTNYSGEGGWYACDQIRFRSGFPEKLGGWVSVTTNRFYGVCRQMWNWVTTFSDNFLALGTNNKLYIEAGNGYYSDITPLRDANPTLTGSNTNNCVSTTNNSSVVTITLATGHGAESNSFVTIVGVAGTSIGGIPVSQINGNQEITVTGANTFTFVTTTNATSTTSAQGGTGISISFEIPPGNASATLGYGWGAGDWGRDAWGLGSTAGGINEQQDDWFLSNYDNDLIANLRNGVMYYWARGATTDPTSALNTRAITLAQVATNMGSPNYDPNAVPSQVMQSMVAQQYQIVLAFGAVPYGQTSPSTFDPLLIRWSDQSNPAQWTPGTLADGTTYSAAGYIRVSRGSRIVCAMPTRQEILVWTDQALYTLQFTGTTSVFALQEYADNISIISPRCTATAASIVYWMGQDKFYAYTGRVETLPCTLRNHVFMNINNDQAEQVVCGTNEQWNEVWWFYPTADSSWNNAYVVFNYLDKVWYYGTLARTAWLDTPTRHWPQAAYTGQNNTTTQSGILYNHEDGADADGLPMVSYIRSNDFDLDDGEQFMISRRLVPDIGFEGSTNTNAQVTMSMYFRNFPGNTPSNFPEDNANVTGSGLTTVNVTPYTDQVFIRARARQMALQIGSSALGSQWQMGSPRLDVRADGKR